MTCFTPAAFNVEAEPAGSVSPYFGFRKLGKKLPEGVQSFDVTRLIKMDFSAEPVKGASATAWGDTVVGGVYSESIDGLYHTTLKVKGKFVLNQVTDAAELYTGE